MFSRSDKVTQLAVNEFIQFRFFPFQPSRTEKFIDWFSSFENLKLTIGVCPGIFLSIGKQNRSGSTKSNQSVLIEGNSIGLVIEEFEIATKPMGESFIDLFYGFTDFSATWCCTSAT